MSPDSTLRTLYIGTYTRPEGHVHGRGEGIYVYQFDPATGRLRHQSTCAGVVNPSFLAVHPAGKTLYAVNELSRKEEGSGTVSAFAIAPATGDLTFLNRHSSMGLAPAYVSTDPAGQFVFVANYSTGNVAVLPVQADGSLLPASASHQHRGAGPHPRQGGPHAHCILPDPTGRFVFAADLGTDQVWVYAFDSAHGRLLPHDHPAFLVSPGSGPRHLAFHPGGHFLYVMTELSSQIYALAYQPQTGTLALRQSISTLPEKDSPISAGAHIQVSPDGRFLYASNRGPDTVAIFAVAEDTGRLTRVGHESTQGKTPRHFTIDPAGQFLLVANQDSDTVVVFRINQENGRLTPTGETCPVPSPVCVRFAPG